MNSIEASQEEEQTATQPTRRKGLGFRHVFGLLASVGFLVAYTLRVCLSVTIVIMSVEANWDEQTQGYVLLSFYLGYVITQIPGGMMAERFGGKKVFGIGMLLTCLFSFLTPAAFAFDYYMLIFVRLLTGLSEGVTFPAMHCMLSRWAPPSERSTLGALVYTGATLGTVTAMTLSAQITDHLNWQAVFYIFSGCGVIWVLLWAWLAEDQPSMSSWVSPEELEYINANMGPRQPRAPTPLKEIFKCRPFWAIFCCHVCNNYGFYTLLSDLPTYFKNVLNFSLETNGWLSALPYVLSICMSLGGSKIADYLRSSGRTTTTQTRKIFNSLGMFVPAFALLMLAFLGGSPTFSVSMVCIAVGFNGFQMVGCGVNHIDIAPNYAGTLMGMTNCAANAMGILAPYVVGWIINGHANDVYNWRIVFVIASVMYLIGNSIFLMFASGEEQPFNYMYTVRQSQNATERTPLLGNSREEVA